MQSSYCRTLKLPGPSLWYRQTFATGGSDLTLSTFVALQRVQQIVWHTRMRSPYDKSKGEIWQSIEAMDRTGMGLIEAQSVAHFHAYLKETKNTICGRYPIQVLKSL